MSRAKKHKIGIYYYNHACMCNNCGMYIGAVYFTLGNLDPAVRSRLEAINLVALFKSELLKAYSLDDILAPEDLKKLNTVN